MDTSFSVTQQGKRVLVVNGYMYQKNKEYRPRNSDSPVIYCHCERKRDINTAKLAFTHVYVGGSKINLVNDSHNHDKCEQTSCSLPIVCRAEMGDFIRLHFAL